MTTLTDMKKRLEECEKLSTDHQSQYCYSYGAEANYISEILQDWENIYHKGWEYEETGWVGYMEGILEDHISEIYKDWYESENNIFPNKEGDFPVGTSQYQWIVWSLHTEVVSFHNYMVEYCEEEGLEIPQWYKEEWVEE